MRAEERRPDREAGAAHHNIDDVKATPLQCPHCGAVETDSEADDG